MECIFCKILKKEIPAKIVYEDSDVIAFKDIAPMAKAHLLFIHKEHSKNLNEMQSENPDSIAKIFQAIVKYSNSSGLEQSGYRVVTNIGSQAGQSVFHTHFHVLGGEPLGPSGA